MKLHLPKGLKVALMTVLGIAAMNTVATATTIIGDKTYTGTVYTWNNTTSGTDAAFGMYAPTTYDDGAIVVDTDNTVSGRSGSWGDVQAIIANGGLTECNTVRFAAATYGQDKKGITYTFTPFTVGGFIVESGATGYSISSSGGNDRIFYLGNNSSTAAYSQINEDFAVNVTASNASLINLRGTQTIDVAEGKKFTLNGQKGVSVTGGVSIDGKGTTEIKSSSSTAITIAEGASLNVASGATLALSGTVNVMASGDAGSETARERSQGNGWGSASYSGVAIGTINGTLSATDVTWRVNGFAAEFNATDKTLSYNGNSSTYYFYGEGVGSAASGAKNVIVDTQSSESIVALEGSAHEWQNLTIESGVVTTTHSAGDGCVKNGDIVIKGGATFQVIGEHDAFGYNAGSCTKSITMEGTSEESMARLELNQTTANSVTMKTNIIMNGNAAITGEKGFNTFGGSITVSGVNNSLERLDLRENVTINVADGGKLTIGKTTFNTDGNKKLTLAGRGTTTVEKESVFKEVTLVGGSLVLKADASMTTLSTGDGSSNSSVTIEEGATLNISGNLNNSWGIKTLTVDGTLNTVEFIVSTGNMVNTITGKGTINADSLVSKNVTNKAAFSGVTLNLGNGGVTDATTKPIEFGDMTVGVREGASGWSASVNHISLVGTTTGTNFNTGAGQTITISGNLGGSGKLVKSGEGTLVLSGANTYSGGTTVNDGILSVQGASALSTGAVSVADGATLLVGAADTTVTSLSLDAGSVFDFGEGGSLSVGTLNIGGAITLGENLTASLESLSGTDTLTLFSGVSAFNYNGSAYTETTSIDSIFSGLSSETYQLSYTGNVLSIGLVQSPPSGKDYIVSDDTPMGAGTYDNLVFPEGTTDGYVEGAVVITGEIKMPANTYLALPKDDASVTNDGVTISGIEDNFSYMIGGEDNNYSVTNAKISVAADAEETVTFSHTVKNSEVVNNTTQSVDLVLAGETNDVTSIEAITGKVTIMNMGEEAITLTNLEIAEGQTVAAYVGALAEEANEATLIIAQGQAGTFAAGSTLLANLVVESGATVNSAGALTMGSTVTLKAGETLNITATGVDLDVAAYVIYTDVESLILEGVSTEPVAEGWYDADKVYSLVKLGSTELDAAALADYTIGYWNKSVSIVNKSVPEPTTSVLSLLALAGLAGRRRRR